MKALTLSDPQMVLALQDEIRRHEEARYDHRLHAVLLVGQGMKCPEVAGKLGDSVRSVETWVKQFDKRGFAALADKERPGRPSRLTKKQIRKIEKTLRGKPQDVGLTGNLWDGKTLSAFIKTEFGVIMKVRQCQRLFHKLGFRYRKPRHLIAHANAEEQESFKKNS